MLQQRPVDVAQGAEELVAVAPAGGFTSPTLMGNMSGGVALKHMDTFVAWVNARLLPGEKAYAAKAGP